MAKLILPFYLADKIFDLKLESDGTVSKIVTYFSFSESEQQEILSILNLDFFAGFSSIFTDTVTEEEWNKTKVQIKKKFQKELFDIDKTL